MLKRHLLSAYGMTLQPYREKWDLPASYPMVASNYAERRSFLARQLGLGRRPEAEAEAEADPAEQSEAPTHRRRSRA